MKTIIKTVETLALAAFLIFTNPVAAQTSDNSTTTSRTTDDDHDNGGKWGLLGLLGLAGLAGLRKKDDHKYTTTNTPGRTNV